MRAQVFYQRQQVRADHDGVSLARVAAATAERQKLGTSGAKSRELFRQLRALLDRVTITPST